MGRIETICSYIDNCKSFADVGCDHGYCTQFALNGGRCETAIISDVSEKCLAKAEKLLAPYIQAGKCQAVCCDGLELIPGETEQVLIAGMGGEEIIKILTEGFIPQKFILQPMKNAPALRKFLLENGCKIIADDIFKDGKFYFIIKGESDGGKEEYDERQLFFGRDSLINPLLRDYADAELIKRETYLSGNVSGGRRLTLTKERDMLKEVLK